MKKCPFQGSDACRSDCALYDRVTDMCAFMAIAQELESVQRIMDANMKRRN